MKHIPVEAFEAAEAVQTPENVQCDIKDALTVFRPKSVTRSTDEPTSAADEAVSSSLVGRTPSPESCPLGTKEPKPWHNLRQLEGRKVSRVISPEDRREAYARWRHADRRGTQLNRHIAFKPDLDHLGPVERMKVWDRLRQRIRCQCQACRFECVMMTTRESDPTTHRGEHMHCLLWVPKKHQATFDRLVPTWAENTVIEPADHVETLEDGKARSAFSYLHKAASPRTRYGDSTVFYRKSGAIAGDRTWSTRNLHLKARTAFDAKRAAEVRIHRERSSIHRPVPPQATTPS